MMESLIGRLTSASMRFKWMVIALAILVMVGGVFAISQFKQELIPAIEFPQTVLEISFLTFDIELEVRLN